MTGKTPLLLGFGFWLLIGGPVEGAKNPRSVYAIKDATIYPVSGPKIERGTIVIRNGLIEAVGVNVTIPPEATVIDGNGLTVYPGLIDSFSDTGLPPAPPEAPRTCRARSLLKGLRLHNNRLARRITP